MNLNERFDVTGAKLKALLGRIARLKIDVDLIEETFARGGGKGGQKVNKTANAVRLSYAPLGLVIRCHRERKRSVNRFLALRELVDRVEMAASPGTSERVKGFERIRRRKARARSRARASSPGTPSGAGPAPAAA